MKLKYILLGIALIVVLSGVALGDTSSDFTVTFEDKYEINNKSAPTLHVEKGETYTFNVNSSGEPFHISTDSSLEDNYDQIYRDGVDVTNRVDNEDATDNGTITWEVPADSPETLYYKSSESTHVGGQINVTSPPAGNTNLIPTFIGTLVGVPYWVFGAFTIGVGITAFVFGIRYDYLSNESTEYL